jgi:hypothetical protein
MPLGGKIQIITPAFSRNVVPSVIVGIRWACGSRPQGLGTQALAFYGHVFIAALLRSVRLDSPSIVQSSTATGLQRYLAMPPKRRRPAPSPSPDAEPAPPTKQAKTVALCRRTSAQEERACSQPRLQNSLSVDCPIAVFAQWPLALHDQEHDSALQINEAFQCRHPCISGSIGQIRLWLC